MLNYNIHFKEVILFTSCVILFHANFTNAQVEQYIQVKEDQPINIEADKLYYDRNKDILYATGNVLLQQDNQIVMADQMLYHRKTSDMYAKDNVAMMRPDGSTFFADQVKLNRLNHEGIIINFKGRIGPQGLIASNSAEMLNKDITELNNAVYSPCKVCSDNPVADQPLWQLRARHVTIDQKEEKMYFENATLEGFGVPFFFTPYFSTPIPGAKRKSGFLTPKYSFNKEFGNMFRLPYYFNLAPNFDATYAGTFIQKDTVTKQGSQLLHELELRHLFDYGSHRVKFFGMEAKRIGKTDGKTTGDHEFKSYIDYSGEFNFSKLKADGFLTVDVKRLHDPTRTFLKKYKISSEDVLKTDFNYQNVQNKYFYQVRTLYFQDLRPKSSQKTTANALPVLNFYYEQPVTNYNIKNNLEFNYLNINRPQGANYHRVIGLSGLEKSFIATNGILLKTKGSVRGDLYQTHFNKIKVVSSYIPQHPNNKASEGRVYPEAVAEVSYPVYKHDAQSQITIEPVFMAIAAPDLKPLKKVDNEDSQDPEISAGNLFSNNRYKGYDLIESGNRLNYGIRSNIKTPWLYNANVVLGQSYRFKRNPAFSANSGLNYFRSDYVTKISIQPTKNLYLNDALRISYKSLKILRHEASLLLKYPKYSVSIDYSAVDGEIITDPAKLGLRRQEIIISGSYNFYGNWWTDAGITRKLGKKRVEHKTPIIATNVGLRHVTECLITKVSMAKDYTTLIDSRPSTTYMFTIEIPTF